MLTKGSLTGIVINCKENDNSQGSETLSHNLIKIGGSKTSNCLIYDLN